MKTNKALMVMGSVAMFLSFSACQNLAKGPEGPSVENAPFEANLQTEEKSSRALSRDSEDNPIQILFTAEGTGEMTHLGKVKVYQEGGRNETNGMEVTRIILIDAKGDSLFMGSRASFGVDGRFTAEEAINGGTGRYANAKGSSTSTGHKNGKSVTWKASGTITY